MEALDEARGLVKKQGGGQGRWLLERLDGEARRVFQALGLAGHLPEGTQGVPG